MFHISYQIVFITRFTSCLLVSIVVNIDNDYLLSSGNWYTFDSYTGGMMPETCPPFYSCGTQAPIWMDGNHPEGKLHTHFSAAHAPT